MPSTEIHVDADRIEFDERGDTIFLIIPTTVLVEGGSHHSISIKNQSMLAKLQQYYLALYLS